MDPISVSEVEGKFGFFSVISSNPMSRTPFPQLEMGRKCVDSEFLITFLVYWQRHLASLRLYLELDHSSKVSFIVY